ncbi:MAG TPA: TPM domain-containing protein [Casimicrobiaceae bacterium]|nr:TPM domain-containing protein [Casimicrobiaceae bacterium]
MRIVRRTLLGLLAAALLLVFAIPRRPPPPPSPAQPEQAFVDKAGIVSPAFARAWAGALLDDPRAQIVVYIDKRPPEGELAAWAIQTASDWKIGAAKNDTGLALFVFTEPRMARMDVGYGLEAVFTDARVRQLLEAHLAPQFSAGRYERGFDAYLTALRDELGGNAARARAAEGAVKAPRESWVGQAASAFGRVPRLVTATSANYLEGGPVARIGILIFVAVGLGIAAIGLALAANTAWRVATLPGKLRARRQNAAAADLKLTEIVLGIGGFGICLAMVVFVLLAVEDFMTRRGSFSGAGAMIVWPMPR